MSKPRVAVAMSGGLDSSVAAALLVEQGYEVVGVTMRLWFGEVADENIRAAAEVARQLGIPHHILDLTEHFRRCVVDDFVAQYSEGKTPNPCVTCNTLIKFGVLAEFAETELGCPKIATGHYARIIRDPGSQTWKLLKGVDRAKDQSYFLYRLNQAQLGKVWLPLGSRTKKESADIAKRMQIKAIQRRESQDVCFIPNERYADFVARKAPDTVKPGALLDADGNEIGSHRGVVFYTVGQRRRLGFAGGRRLYVTRIDAAENTVTIGPEEMLYAKTVRLRDVVFVSGSPPSGCVVVSARVRYNAQEAPANLRIERADKAELVFLQPQKAVAPGQSAVFYLGEEVLGGGIIE